MSRIGKLPISIPPGVTVSLNGPCVTVQGPNGELKRVLRPEITVRQEDSKLLVLRNSDDRMVRSLHGLSRTLVANMVKGVTEGFVRKLEIVGVGYRAAMDGRKLIMQLGYSHPVEVDPPAGLSIAVTANTKVSVSGIDRQAVGDLAALIRAKRAPEVYKGKGIR